MAENLENQLLDACKVGNLNLVKDLISKGANIHAYDDWALRMAASYGHLDIVKYLVSQGANIHDYDEQAQALYWAKMNNHLDVVKFLESVILREKRKEIWQKV